MHVWAHSWSPEPEFPPIPWGEIAAQPSVYYDTAKFTLPYALAAPATLNTLETTVWAEYLVRTSSIFEGSPFIFYPKVSLSPSPPGIVQEELVNSGIHAAKDATIPDTTAETPSVEEPGLSTQDTLAQLQHGSKAGPILEESADLESEQASGPLRQMPNQVQVPFGGGGQKRARQAPQGRKRGAKKIKRTKNADNGGGATANTDRGGRRKSSRVPRNAVAPLTVKKALVKRRTNGYVYSDEEEEVFAPNAA
ncbi:hypothetical protein B0H16DRAFT_1724096 [Mycena metata]|uniref:Uncharacterized protein n=1 Tax=Mycena metata TaxID=1033252 RepID=A0AAD7IXH1_9AGAR|nr:hypothetical protein B0H16DRAFT_1724096 [Mycena metata]